MVPVRNAKRFIDKALKQPGYAARVAAKRLVAYAYYRFADGRAALPEAITLFLTHRCNLRCKMCGQWGEGGVTKKEGPEFVRRELSAVELGTFIDGVAPFRPNITLFGGEPLLHPASIGLIRHIKEKRLHCLIITNGFLVEGLAEDLVASGLDELNVSLDGGRELHDGIRGMPGLFDRIMAGLQKVRALKAAAGTKKPLVNLQCTVTKYNYRDLDQMTAVAREAGANSLTFHNLIFLDRSILDKQKPYDGALACSSADWEGFVFESGIDVETLRQKMAEIRSGHYPFSVDFYPNFTRKELTDYYQNPGYAPRGSSGRCVSPWMVAYVFPDGEVRPCLNTTYSYGNIKSEPFGSVWNSDKAIAFRRHLKNARIFPVCARCTELYRY